MIRVLRFVVIRAKIVLRDNKVRATNDSREGQISKSRSATSKCNLVYGDGGLSRLLCKSQFIYLFRHTNVNMRGDDEVSEALSFFRRFPCLGKSAWVASHSLLVLFYSLLLQHFRHFILTFLCHIFY